MVDDLRSHGFTGNIVPWTRGVDRTVLKATVTHPVRQADDVLRLLYVGRVSREKNLDELCRLQDRYNVTVVGDGPDRTRLERQYRGVIFAGYCSGTTLANHYAAADVFVFPSLVDTFGIVMIEANSFGTPVAAYPVPGPIDVVESGVNGTLSNNLVEAIEACRHLDRARIEEHSQQWTWQNCWNIFRDNLIPVM
jgi:glycosyltransferase involved in cell wall biosynthesis